MSKEYTIKINGNVYRLNSFTVRHTQELLDYAKKVLPDPVTVLLETANLLPEGQKEKFLEKHLDSAYEEKKKIGTLNGTNLEEVMKTPNGFKKMCHLMFTKHHPNLTEDDVEELMDQYIEQDGQDIFKEIISDSKHVPVSEVEAERQYFRGNGKARKTAKR